MTTFKVLRLLKLNGVYSNVSSLTFKSQYHFMHEAKQKQTLFNFSQSNLNQSNFQFLNSEKEIFYFGLPVKI